MRQCEPQDMAFFETKFSDRAHFGGPDTPSATSAPNSMTLRLEHPADPADCGRSRGPLLSLMRHRGSSWLSSRRRSIT